MDTKQIEQHYLANSPRLLKKLTFRLGSIWAAEDVVHTAYERAIRYQSSCEEGRFDQWFSMVITNAIRDFQNEERGYSPLHDDYEEAASLDCPHFPEQIMKEIFELIDTKSVDQIEILNFFFKYGYSATDISQITSHSYAKIHKTFQRFRDELKELYKE